MTRYTKDDIFKIADQLAIEAYVIGVRNPITNAIEFKPPGTRNGIRVEITWAGGRVTHHTGYKAAYDALLTAWTALRSVRELTKQETA